MELSQPRIVFLTAGAGGMICGSCLQDNALVGALRRLGVDAVLVPAYTPIRTDESDHSLDQVVFGGINLFLRQSRWGKLFPRMLTRWLDRPAVLRSLTWNRIPTTASHLGAMTLSMLAGADGPQRDAVQDLVRLLDQHLKPDILVLSNLLIAGAVPLLRQQLQVPIFVVLQGDDLFIDELPPDYRLPVEARLRQIAREVDGFLVHSHYYAELMSTRLEVSRSRFHWIPLGISLFQDSRTAADDQVLSGDRTRSSNTNRARPSIGYLARIAPEKGLDMLCEAFVRLKEQRDLSDCTLQIAGWMSASQQSYLDRALQPIHSRGWTNDVSVWGTVDRAGKESFLRSVDILSVPTRYRDPKGLYVLEALSLKVPVVQPHHGAFPELLQRLGGGLLFSPFDIGDLTEKLAALLRDPNLRESLGEQGSKSVQELHNIESTAKAMLDIFRASRSLAD